MTLDQHIARHQMLHRSFDELVADFIMQNDGKMFTNTTLLELVEWSFQQTKFPTLANGTVYEENLTEGDQCPYAGCKGRMGFQPVENCSCHVNPPCGACVDNPLVCLACGWTLGEPNGPPSLLEVCKKTLEFFHKVRAEEGDPLRPLQDRFHGPIRELLETAIAREEGKS
jgi:hypothetical protein